MGGKAKKPERDRSGFNLYLSINFLQGIFISQFSANTIHNLYCTYYHKQKGNSINIPTCICYTPINK